MLFCVCLLCIFVVLKGNYYYFFFYLSFVACQDYFTRLELSQSLGGAKTGEPQEKPPDHPQAKLGLSHM